MTRHVFLSRIKNMNPDRVWCPRFSVFGDTAHPEGWTPNSIHHQRQLPLPSLGAETFAQVLHDSVLEAAATRIPAAGAGQLLHATAQPVEPQHTRPVLQMLAQFGAQPR